MTTAAVICEYNPLHKGHLYQLHKIKESLGADRILLIMSGDFTERGEPALFSKEVRTQMALKSGADLVLLLPVSFATAAADAFAYGAVKLLDGLGVVDWLCFGAECDDPSLLMKISEEMAGKASPASPQMQALLKEGMTYAQARARLFPDYVDILSGSNNILALEYLNALRECSSSIRPWILHREGADYNAGSTDSEFASALMIRRLLSEGRKEEALAYVPGELKDFYEEESFLFPKDFDAVLYEALLREEDFSVFTDVSPDLSDRIRKLLPQYRGFDSFADLVKTKNLTRARVNRALLHILLNMKGDASLLKDRADGLTHVRVLGFNKSHADLLTKITEGGTITPVTKVPDVSEQLNRVTKEEFDRELHASALYDGLNFMKNQAPLLHEYAKTLVFTE